MKKEDLKVNNIKSFSFKASLNDSKKLKYYYDVSIGKELWENFLFDLLKNVSLPEWNKANVSEKSKGKEEWIIEIKSKDDGIISFYGENLFPERWEVLLDLIEVVENKIHGEKKEEDKA
jgi:hypothetical protein